MEVEKPFFAYHTAMDQPSEFLSAVRSVSLLLFPAGHHHTMVTGEDDAGKESARGYCLLGQEQRIATGYRQSI